MRPGDRVGVAVSGGADSVGLLRVLLGVRKELGAVFSVVHLNHKLRGAESDADENFVRALAESHELEFISRKRDVRGHAVLHGLSIETAARELRYEFFNELLHEGQLNKIATGHTLDDQAETVLYKLVRGAGSRGLAGIYPKLEIKLGSSAIKERGPTLKSECAIVRPLLQTQGSELEAYLKEVGQPWREDSTNRELQYTRNRIRHEVLPLLEKAVNPGAKTSLAEAAEIARAEEEFWSEQIAELLSHAWRRTDRGGVLSLKPVLPSNLALQRRLIRAAAASLGLNLEFRHVEKLLAVIGEATQVSLPHDWTALAGKDELTFTRKLAEPVAYQYELLVPGRVEVPEAKIAIETVVLQPGELDSFARDHLLEFALANGLIVRNWRDGDRFWPAHTRQPKKIKELLQDRHITGYEKKQWPIVAAGEEVVWVRGFGVRRDSQPKQGPAVLIREVGTRE